MYSESNPSGYNSRKVSQIEQDSPPRAPQQKINSPPKKSPAKWSDHKKGKSSRKASEKIY